MASVNKTKCYNIIENYLSSRLDTWKISEDEITTKELSGTPKEKREICFTLIGEISKCKTIDDWAFLVFLISDIRDSQKAYEKGTLGYFSNEQAIVPMLDKIRFTILDCLKFDGTFISYLTNLEEKEHSLTNKQIERSKHRKYHGKTCKGALNETQLKLSDIKDQLNALDIDKIPAEHRVIALGTSNNNMIDNILNFVNLTHEGVNDSLHRSSGSYSM